ncbi:hypothetical protein C8R44DRAFT_876266 [Mycena epipterygia]|nr:hypothetical protein C8R44DRAFT_876266 [Mycena epipterygia]
MPLSTLRSHTTDAALSGALLRGTLYSICIVGDTIHNTFTPYPAARDHASTPPPEVTLLRLSPEGSYPYAFEAYTPNRTRATRPRKLLVLGLRFIAAPSLFLLIFLTDVHYRVRTPYTFHYLTYTRTIHTRSI